MPSTKMFVIDDDDFTAAHLEEIIGDAYELTHIPDAETGIAKIIETLPGLVLMDVNMPGMDGYEACRIIKGDARTQDIPVIFLSARVEIEDRLAGYEAGGDDYLTKPFDPDELLNKISIVLRNHEKNRELSKSASYAREVAMAAMSAAGDVGIIMRFLREMVGCLDLASLTNCVFKTTDAFGCDVSLQLRNTGAGTLSRSREGICSPLEESILTNMGLCARIVDLKSRSAFNHNRVTLIVKNMPVDDPGLYGRIKDSMATIVEAIDLHLESLNVVNEALNRGDSLMQLLKSNTAALREIEKSYRFQRTSSSEILNTLVANIEDSFVHLGLTESQERFLQDMVRSATEQAQALYDKEIEVEGIMQQIGHEMGTALQQEVDGVVEASSGATRVELF